MEKDNGEIEEISKTENIESVEKKINNEERTKDEEKLEEINTQKEEGKTKIKGEPIEEGLENNKEENEKKKISLKAIIFIILAIIVVLFLSTIFAIVNINNSNIIKGIYLESLELSNLSKEDAANIINERLKNIETIELNYEGYNTIVKIEEIGLEIDVKEAINKAINLGKTNNIIIDNYSILKANLFKEKLELDIKFDEEKFNNAIKNIQAEMPEAVKQYSYEIKENELIITNGEIGKAIDVDILKGKIIANIKEQFNEKITIVDIPVNIVEPEEIDIEKIYKEVKKEAKDAYIIEEPFELHKEENGVDFDITLEKAKELLKEQKATYTIPLKITKPKVEVKDLGDKLFKQTLAQYSTIYDAGNTNRSHNIALAAKTINGTILLPGETFSYNGILGNTNKEKGYKLGTAYVSGKVVESYGGGICQVSSTLYNAALYANLEIVERYNHSYIVSYVPAGRDATVAYGGKDFKFKNTRNYPVKIVASAKNGVVSISIKGIKEEKEYEIVLTSSVLSTTPRAVIYENNSALEEGKQKVIQKGYDGKTSIAYKIVKYNGKTISKTVLSKDTYKAMNKIVQVGTKKTTTNSSSSNTATQVTANTAASSNKTNSTTQKDNNTTNNINNNNTTI